MVDVETFLLMLLGRVGDPYVYGEKDPADPTYRGPADCSGLTSWAGAVLGLKPTVPDGSQAQWHLIQQQGTILPIAAALAIRGAWLFIDETPGSNQPGHVAINLGDGTTVEARGAAWGIGCFPATTARFNLAGLYPGIDYFGKETDDMGVCIPSWAGREADAREFFYRLSADRTKVYAYNGAPLLRVDGDDFSVPYIRLPAVLNGRPLDVAEIEQTGAVVVACEDGGIIDVAARP